MKSKIIICLLIVSQLSFLSCSSDNDSPNNPQYQLENKWWYSPDNSTTDLYFNSDGTYLSKFAFGTNVVNSNGQWEWISQSEKTVKIFNLQGNALSGFQGKITELSAHTMSIKMTLNQGETYTETVQYVDVND